MKRFLIKCGLFSLPLWVLFTPPLIHLETYRELESIDEMASQSQHNGALIGLGYTDPMHLVKHAVLQNRQPEVIALGTSRVLQFRDFCFSKPESFYNCGRSVGKVQDLEAFLSSYPGEKPKVIILGLDQDMFSVDDEDLLKKPRTYQSKGTSYGTRLTKGTKAFWEAWSGDEIVTGTTLQGTTNFIGRNARLENEGYRADGSYCYGRVIRQSNQQDAYDFKQMIRRIDKGKGRFAPATEINPNAIQQIDNFLKSCKEMEIHVVGFLPPYGSAVYDRFKEDALIYPHVFDLHGQLKPIFEANGMLVEDYTDIRSLSANDFETIDGLHGSEVCYLKLLKLLSANDPILASQVDRDSLDDYIAHAFSARQVVEELPEATLRAPNKD
jgi:hypothetical protein